MSKIYDENGNDVDLDEWLKQKKTKLITRESTIEEVQRYADVYEVPYGENIPIDCGWFFTLADNAYEKGRADAIDEFVEMLKNEWTIDSVLCATDKYRLIGIYKRISKQLKEQGQC